jgi:hypothetical protein
MDRNGGANRSPSATMLPDYSTKHTFMDGH